MSSSIAPLIATPVWEGSVGWTSECLPYSEGILERYRKAGFTHLSLTVAAEWNTPFETLRHLGRVRRELSERAQEVALVARPPKSAPRRRPPRWRS